MAEKTWTQGTPCWVDLMTSDQEAALRFYRELFGWAGEAGDPEYGGYASMTSDGKPVAGIVGSMPGNEQPPMWNTYLAADSADAIASAVTENGGQVLMGTMDVGEMGRMGFFTDPQGAAFGIWQAGSHKGFQKWNEPGAVGWDHLYVEDRAAAGRFYSAVFGVDASDQDGMTLLELGGKPVAGITAYPEMPGGGPGRPSWSVVFSVGNTDDAVAKVEELGGSVVSGPFDTPYGRLALVRDPQGAEFTLGTDPAEV